MAIPDFQTLMLPTLRAAEGGEIKASDAVDQLADALALTEAERSELLPSGRQARFANRVHWAVTYLVKAGLLTRPRRGWFAITPNGRSVLSNAPERITIAFLSQFEGFDAFQGKSVDDGVGSDSPSHEPAVQTPDERVEAAFEDLNAELRDELLERILAMRPDAFEKLIVDLMLGMGYGANGSGERVGRSHDGGIDGVINEDVLGLDIIHLQAKRYAVGSCIGVDKIREFAGALDERGATKGVFVTTSHFAPAALDYAQRSPKRLILIDGAALTRLLVQFGVAVRSYRTLDLKRIDVDYFDGADG